MIEIGQEYKKVSSVASVYRCNILTHIQIERKVTKLTKMFEWL